MTPISYFPMVSIALLQDGTVARFLFLVFLALAGCQSDRPSIPEALRETEIITIDIDALPIRELLPAARIGEASGGSDSWLATPSAMTIAHDSIWIADRKTGSVLAMARVDSTLVHHFGTSGQGPEELDWPTGLFATSDRFFVHEPNARVKIFDRSWRSVETLNIQYVPSAAFSFRDDAWFLPAPTGGSGGLMKCAASIQTTDCTEFLPALFGAGSPMSTHNLTWVASAMGRNDVAAGWLTLPFMVMFDHAGTARRTLVFTGEHERTLQHPWNTSGDIRQSGPFPGFYRTVKMMPDGSIWAVVGLDIVRVAFVDGNVQAQRFRIADHEGTFFSPNDIAVHTDGSLYALSTRRPWLYRYDNVAVD